MNTPRPTCCNKLCRTYRKEFGADAWLECWECKRCHKRLIPTQGPALMQESDWEALAAICQQGIAYDLWLEQQHDPDRVCVKKFRRSNVRSSVPAGLR